MEPIEMVAVAGQQRAIAYRNANASTPIQSPTESTDIAVTSEFVDLSIIATPVKIKGMHTKI